MPSLFTEDTYEQAIIELFENMGYDHIYASDFDRDVPAISIIDKILKRNDHFTPHILIDTVITICDGNEADPQHREYFFNVPSGLNIIPSESRQILYYDAIDLALSDVRKHSLEFRSLEIDTAETIIRIGIDNLDLRVGLKIVHDQFVLIGDAVANSLSPVSHIAIFS